MGKIIKLTTKICGICIAILALGSLIFGSETLKETLATVGGVTFLAWVGLQGAGLFDEDKGGSNGNKNRN